MIVLVDQDNTLCDFIGSTVNYVGKLYKMKLSFTAKDCKEYDVFKQMFPFADQTSRHEMTEKVFNEPGFWIDMTPMPGAIEVMEWLHKQPEVDLYIATSPWVTSRNCIPEKQEWVHRHLPWFDLHRLIFCYNKSLLKGDVIIDDAPLALENHICPYTLIYDYPYNQNVQIPPTTRQHRVSNWKDIKKWFQQGEPASTKRQA